MYFLKYSMRKFCVRKLANYRKNLLQFVFFKFFFEPEQFSYALLCNQSRTIADNITLRYFEYVNKRWQDTGCGSTVGLY